MFDGSRSATASGSSGKGNYYCYHYAESPAQVEASEIDRRKSCLLTLAAEEDVLCSRGRRGHTVEAQSGSVATHSGNAKGNVGVQIHSQFLRALHDVFAVDTTRESLVFKLLSHTLQVYVEDGFSRFDERNGSQKTG